MSYHALLNAEHSSRLPFVRIKRIHLQNFQGVKNGVLEMNCAREHVPFDTKSDILGLYGQNGSGKSSLVNAINVVKGMLSGYLLPNDFVRYIDVDSPDATITIEFDFQYPDGRQAMVEYSVTLRRTQKENADLEQGYRTYSEQIAVCNEVIRTQIYPDKIARVHTIVDTGAELFCTEANGTQFFGDAWAKGKEELMYLKRKSYDDSRSFVFHPKVAEMMQAAGVSSRYVELLVELNMYAEQYLFVIGRRSDGLMQLRVGIPLFLPSMSSMLLLSDKKPIPAVLRQPVEDAMRQINRVIGTIIPDLELGMTITPATLSDGSDGICVHLISKRGQRQFPFSYESDGIIKLVCILVDYIFAFNQGSATLVVDEFDSGVYEYLLGELLQIFENAGKGQFIFTSHNLRPLEVIDKKFIRFTTSDPENRYIRLTNVGKTNNLRDLYLRCIQLGGQDVEIYRRTKSFKMVKAIRSAGEEFING